MEKAPCLLTFQNRWEPGGLRKPQTSAQLFGVDPSPHNGVGPAASARQSCQYFINSTEIVAAATTPGCAIEITCNLINVLKDHNSTKGLDDFLGNTSFLGVDIVDVY